MKGRLLSDVVIELAKDLDIRLNWPVSKIEDGNEGKVRIYGPNGAILTCGKVIVTGMLQSYLILIVASFSQCVERKRNQV